MPKTTKQAAARPKGRKRLSLADVKKLAWRSVQHNRARRASRVTTTANPTKAGDQAKARIAAKASKRRPRRAPMPPAFDGRSMGNGGW